MNTLKPIFLLVGMALLSVNALAQYTQTEPHWRVHTDPNSLTTTVHFFDADQHLIYQESLPGKYFKLTEKNARKLDRILAQKLSQELIASSVKLSELNKETLPARKPGAFIPKLYSPATAWNCQTLIKNQTNLTVGVDNPTQKTLVLTLKNKKGSCVYIRRITSSVYQYSFRVSHLSKGTYAFSITDGEGGIYHRNLLIGSPANQITFQLNDPQPEGGELVKQ